MKDYGVTLSALDACCYVASGMRMRIRTVWTFDSRTIEIEAYLPNDARRPMRGHSYYSFELAAAKLLKHYRPEIYADSVIITIPEGIGNPFLPRKLTLFSAKARLKQIEDFYENHDQHHI